LPYTELKDFIRKFKEVATKYLIGHPAWSRLAELRQRDGGGEVSSPKGMAGQMRDLHHDAGYSEDEAHSISVLLLTAIIIPKRKTTICRSFS